VVYGRGGKIPQGVKEIMRIGGKLGTSSCRRVSRRSKGIQGFQTRDKNRGEKKRRDIRKKHHREKENEEERINGEGIQVNQRKNAKGITLSAKEEKRITSRERVRGSEKNAGLPAE